MSSRRGGLVCRCGKRTFALFPNRRCEECHEKRQLLLEMRRRSEKRRKGVVR